MILLRSFREINMKVAQIKSISNPIKEYIVVGISFYKKSKSIFFHLIDDDGRWIQRDSSELKIVDSKPSKHWIARWDNENHFFIAPPDFFEPYYFDKLTDLDIEIEKNFKTICSKIELENSLFPLKTITFVTTGIYQGMFIYIEYSENLRGFILNISEKYNSVKENPDTGEFFNTEDELISFVKEKSISFSII